MVYGEMLVINMPALWLRYKGDNNGTSSFKCATVTGLLSSHTFSDSGP